MNMSKDEGYWFISDVLPTLHSPDESTNPCEADIEQTGTDEHHQEQAQKKWKGRELSEGVKRALTRCRRGR